MALSEDTWNHATKEVQDYIAHLEQSLKKARERSDAFEKALTMLVLNEETCKNSKDSLYVQAVVQNKVIEVLADEINKKYPKER